MIALYFFLNLGASGLSGEKVIIMDTIPLFRVMYPLNRITVSSKEPTAGIVSKSNVEISFPMLLNLIARESSCML